MSTDRDMDRLLREVGESLEYPRTEIVSTVLQRLGNESIRPRLQLSWAIAAVILFLVFVLTVVLTLSPTARDAVASRLGIPGIEIIFGGEGEIPGENPVFMGDDLHLGRRVSLDQARELSSFRILAPLDLGKPDQVYFAEPPSGGQVSLVYHANESLPPVLDSAIGLLLMEFRGTLDPAYYKKVAYSPGTTVQTVEVGGAWGVWIEGQPHVLVYQDARDQTHRSYSRLAGNTLIWEEGGVSYRLESSISKERAIEIASNLR